MISFHSIQFIFPRRVKTWANKLGFELSQLGKFVTNADKFNDSYKQAVLKPRDGNALVHEIAKDIKAMMESKISAIKVHNSKTSLSNRKKKKNLLKNSNTFLALRIYIYIIYYIAKKKINTRVY